jgi:hypothetical protein
LCRAWRAAVVPRVVRRDLGERHVADDDIERTVLDAEVLEGRSVDGGSGAVEVLRDLGGRLVELDGGQSRRGGSEADEVAGTAAGLEYPHVASDTERLGCLPHGADHRCRRVVRVQGRATRLCPAVLRPQQATQFGSLRGKPVVVVIEDLRDGTPPGPAGQDRLLAGIGPPASVLTAGVQDGESVEVGSQLGGDTRRREVSLSRRSKGRGSRRRVPFVYSGALIV